MAAAAYNSGKAKMERGVIWRHSFATLVASGRGRSRSSRSFCVLVIDIDLVCGPQIVISNCKINQAGERAAVAESRS